MRKTLIRFGTGALIVLLGVLVILLYPDHGGKGSGSEPAKPALEETSPLEGTLSANAADYTAAQPATMTVQEMTEDLDFLVKTLEEVHPSLIEGWSESQRHTIGEIYNQIQQPLTKEEFYFAANNIVTLLHDGHTAMSPFFTGSEAITLPIYWTQEGPVVLNSVHELKRGDLLVNVGGLAPDELLKELTRVVPAENEQWVKISGVGMFKSSAFLRHLDLVQNGKVPVTVEREGNLLNLELRFNPSSPWETMQTPYVTGNTDYGYSFDEELSIGTLRINTCDFNQDYIDIVESFFTEAASRNIRRVAVDLRNNTGGDSRVIDEFLRYMNGLNKYNSYTGLVRYSKQATEQRGEEQDSGYIAYDPYQVHVTNPGTPSFSGQLYVLTSPKTFSSGNWFAVVIQDNQLGTVIGEPTGNQPSSYGDILRFSLPHSGFQFTVSYKQFKRPNSELDAETALMPDILVHTTRQDIIDGRDPQMEKLKEIISQETK
ncbi:S41 family peptidase [Paenibacillus sp. M1]|uniref:S41 family peptidase n=1 Tax=Paenibacillus haidiansis TaxID=1574488 RepID=A0ABU7VN27_9BACL